MPFGFGGSKTTLQLTLVRHEYMAGDVVRATVNVGGAIDDKAQGTRLEILYTHQHKELAPNTNTDPDVVVKSRTVQHRKYDVVVASRAFSEGTAVELGERIVEIPIPPDAPPSARDLVDWQVKAVIDRRRAGDVTSAVPIQVASRADQYAAWAERPPSVAPGCYMEIRIPTRSFALGSTISGTLSVRPEADLDANEIRVDLARYRVDMPGNPSQVTETDKVRSVKLAGDLKLAAGDTKELPFEIEIPADQPPSYEARNNSVQWFLNGVASRRLRDDFTVWLELNVHGAQPAKG